MQPPRLCQCNCLWGHAVRWIRKFTFFTRLFSRQVSSLTSTLTWLTAWLCKQLCWQAEDKQLPSLALPCSPSCWELQWTSEPALCSVETPTLAGWESAVCKQKALGRSHSTAAWKYQRSLAGGHNVYLMVSTICIYINSNDYFSHIHAPC